DLAPRAVRRREPRTLAGGARCGVEGERLVDQGIALLTIEIDAELRLPYAEGGEVVAEILARQQGLEPVTSPLGVAGGIEGVEDADLDRDRILAADRQRLRVVRQGVLRTAARTGETRRDELGLADRRRARAHVAAMPHGGPHTSRDDGGAEHCRRQCAAMAGHELGASIRESDGPRLDRTVARVALEITVEVDDARVASLGVLR